MIIENYKQKIGRFFYIVDKNGQRINFGKHDEVPFKIALIKDGCIFLVKKVGNWEHREDITDERLKSIQLSEYLN